MSETVHLVIPVSDWLPLPVTPPISKGRVANSGNTVVVYTQAINKPVADSNAGVRLVDDNLFDYEVVSPENIWVKSLHAPGILSLTPGEPTPMSVRDDNGVPTEFSMLASASVHKLIPKGSILSAKLFPTILNEHVAMSRGVTVGTVTPTNKVCQIFKASKDNISNLTFMAENGAGVAADNFETYVTSAQLQAAWIATGNLATLSAATFKNGAQAMTLPDEVVGDAWEFTLSAPQDLTNFTVALWLQQQLGFDRTQFRLTLRDVAGNFKATPLVVQSARVWEHFFIEEIGMIEDGGNAANTDMTQIDRVGFVVQRRDRNLSWVDDVILVPPPGDLRVRLHDMGNTIPVSGVTSISDGTQYAQIGEQDAAEFIVELSGGKKVYALEDFNANLDTTIKVPARVPLTVNNYYLIELSYIDTETDIVGTDATQLVNQYVKGFACTAPDDVTPLVEIAPNVDLIFMIYSRQEVYMQKFSWHFDSAPGADMVVHGYILGNNFGVTDVLIDHHHRPRKDSFIDYSQHPYRMQDGGSAALIIDDDVLDNVSDVVFTMTYFYEKPTVNG